MEISEHPLVLFHTQGLQPGVYGDVFTGHHLLPLQDNSTKEKTKIQSNFVIPNHFYKIETEFFKCFLSKTILGKKSDKLCSYQIVLKKRSQNRSKAALQDNDSVKFKFVYALQDRVLQDRDRLSHIPRKLDQTLPIPRQSHILSTVLKDEERVKVHIHSKT